MSDKTENSGAKQPSDCDFNTGKQTKILEALSSFKDWSNYLLVTTVAALGWVTTQEVIVGNPILRTIMIACFAFSIVFGIFTLALIPVITQAIDDNSSSFYEVEGKYRPFFLWGKQRRCKIKQYCWPQHMLFLVGILIYAYATSDFVISISF